MKIQLKFEGGQEIARELNLLAEGPRREVSLRALMAGAAPIVDAASKYARRSNDGKHFADHIGAKPVPKTQTAQADGDTNVGIGVPNEFFYDYFIEFGTEHHPAWPFYRPALDIHKRTALTVISAVYWTAFEEVVGG